MDVLKESGIPKEKYFNKIKFFLLAVFALKSWDRDWFFLYAVNKYAIDIPAIMDRKWLKPIKNSIGIAKPNIAWIAEIWVTFFGFKSAWYNDVFNLNKIIEINNRYATMNPNIFKSRRIE